MCCLWDRMTSLIKANTDRRYVDLVVSYSGIDDGADEEMGPPVRYYL